MKTPNWAAKVWTDADWIYLNLPAVNGLTAHTVRFPADSMGFRIALDTLQRRSEAHPSQNQLGTRGDPTQHNVEQLVSEFKGEIKRPKKKRVIPAKMKANVKQILRERGMI